MLLPALLKDVVHSPFSKEFEKFEVTSICADSRQATEGSLFVAVPGASAHGIHFIDDAIKRGARVIITDQPAEKISGDPRILALQVENPAMTLRDVAVRFYGNPSSK